MREWTKLELAPPQRDRRGTTRWNRTSIRSILLNPRIAGLSVYHGEIVGQGQWEPLVSEETWRAVRGILEDPARKPPRGVRTLLGGIALCPCGNVAVGRPVPHRASGLPLLDAHPGPVPASRARGPQGRRGG